MIRFDASGVSILDPVTGEKVSIFNPAYDRLGQIKDKQDQAEKDNTKTAYDYTLTLKRLQSDIDAGLIAGTVAPIKPQRKVVSDAGEVTNVPFVPPLPDLVIPKFGEPLPTVIAIPVADKQANQQAILYNMVLAMFRKMFPEA